MNRLRNLLRFRKSAPEEVFTGGYCVDTCFEYGLRFGPMSLADWAEFTSILDRWQHGNRSREQSTLAELHQRR